MRNRCPFCKELYADMETHMTSHNVVYVPIPRADLDALIFFFTSGDSSLLREEFIRYMLDFFHKVKKKDLVKEK